MGVFVIGIRHCIVVSRAPAVRLFDNVEGFLPTASGQKTLHIIKGYASMLCVRGRVEVRRLLALRRARQ